MRQNITYVWTNSQFSLYSDEFLQKSCAVVLMTSEEKVIVICSFISDVGDKRFALARYIHFRRTLNHS